MTTTTRTASKFCAISRSECLKTFCLDLIHSGFPGHVEPWSECQPEESRPREARPEDSSICIYIYIYIYIYDIPYVYILIYTYYI